MWSCGDTVEPKTSNLKWFDREKNKQIEKRKKEIKGFELNEENSRRFYHYDSDIPKWYEDYEAKKKKEIASISTFIYGHIQSIEHSAFRISETKEMRYHPPIHHSPSCIMYNAYILSNDHHHTNIYRFDCSDIFDRFTYSHSHSYSPNLQ